MVTSLLTIYGDLTSGHSSLPSVDPPIITDIGFPKSLARRQPADSEALPPQGELPAHSSTITHIHPGRPTFVCVERGA